MIIYLDFDGTVVTHEFPMIGRLLPNVQKVLTKLNTSGHEIVINTMRVNFHEESFPEAMNYMKRLMGREFPHTEKKLSPPIWNLETAKESRQLFIDDQANKIPLRQFVSRGRWSVDWFEVEKQLIQAGIIH